MNETAQDKVALLVLGCHRSGTSAATRLLSLCGASLPTEMVLGSDSNSKGHWESRPAVLLNDSILEYYGSSWSEWDLPELRIHPGKKRDEFVSAIANLVDSEFSGAELIAVKDPRICKLTGLYLEALGTLSYRIVPILVVRNPLEVIDSMMARPSWPEGRGRLDAALVWLSYVLQAERGSRGLSRHVWIYPDITTKWGKAILRVGKESGVPFPVRPPEVAEQVAEFFDVKLHHQKRTTGDLSRDRVAIGWLREAFDAFKILATSPASAHAQKRLDAVAAQFRASVPLFLSAREEGDQFRARTEEEKQDLARLLSDSEANHSAAQQQIEALRVAREQADAEAQQQIEALRVAREQADAEAQQQIEALRVAHEQARTEARQRVEEADRLSAAQQAEIEALQAARARADAEAQQQIEALEAAKAEIEAEARQRSEEAQRNQAVASRLRTLIESYAPDRRELEKLPALQSELAAAYEHIEALKQSTSWRLTAPLRGLKTNSGKVVSRLGTIGRLATVKGGLLSTSWAASRILAREGVSGLRQRYSIHRQRSGHAPIVHRHSQEQRTDFINSRIPGRAKVLLSGWHRAVIAALEDPAIGMRGNATLGLSLVTYNSARWLPDFFASLRRQSFPLSRLNICVVDNGSTDDTLALLEAEKQSLGSSVGSFQILRSDNRGFGAGHDTAIRQLKDEFVLVSNVDTKFHAGSLLKTLAVAMADEGDIGAWELRQCPYEHPKFYDPVTLETSWNSHACVLLRRRAYEAVTGYDPDIFMYGEDVELSYRFRSQGWRLRYLPQVTLTHFVDLQDTTLRPHQLSGSLSANVLLRYRYGGTELGQEGERLLGNVAASETDRTRREAMQTALQTVAAKKERYAPVHASAAAAFPFRDFDYDMVREGPDVALESEEPAGNMPLVTIVTRTHGPKLSILSEAIVSVLNQSYPNIEHIVVEDRTDHAQPLVARAAEGYPGKTIRYLKSNGAGRVRAGNFGLENARGEILMFLDNDDLLFADHVELLVRELMRKPDSVAAFSLAWDTRTRFAPDGSYIETEHLIHAGQKQGFSRERFLVENYIPIQAIAFRRSLFEAEGGFDERLDHLEDWNLWARYAIHGDFAYVPKVTSLYRTPDDDLVRQLRQAELDSAYASVRQIIGKRVALGLQSSKPED